MIKRECSGLTSIDANSVGYIRQGDTPSFRKSILDKFRGPLTFLPRILAWLSPGHCGSLGLVSLLDEKISSSSCASREEVGNSSSRRPARRSQFLAAPPSPLRLARRVFDAMPFSFAGCASSVCGSHPAPAAFVTPAMSIAVKRVVTPSELQACRTLRRQVFVDELSVDPSIEFDKYDNSEDPADPSASTAHYVAEDTESGAVVGTCRVRAPHPAVRKLERFCVASLARRRGVARELAARVAADASMACGGSGDDASQVAPLIFCHAKRESAAIYERLGWTKDGSEGFEEAGVPHVAMVRRARPGGASMGLGHVCLRTHDIERARMFYSILGYNDVERFLVEGCRAAWIEVRSSFSRPLTSMWWRRSIRTSLRPPLVYGSVFLTAC